MLRRTLSCSTVKCYFILVILRIFEAANSKHKWINSIFFKFWKTHLHSHFDIREPLKKYYNLGILINLCCPPPPPSPSSFLQSLSHNNKRVHNWANISLLYLMFKRKTVLTGGQTLPPPHGLSQKPKFIFLLRVPPTGLWPSTACLKMCLTD